jgi:hypothetical protein
MLKMCTLLFRVLDQSKRSRFPVTAPLVRMPAEASFPKFRAQIMTLLEKSWMCGDCKLMRFLSSCFEFERILASETFVWCLDDTNLKEFACWCSGKSMRWINLKGRSILSTVVVQILQCCLQRRLFYLWRALESPNDVAGMRRCSLKERDIGLQTCMVHWWWYC